MTAIKSYTDLSQSKILSKILSLESADMYYEWPNKKVNFKDDKYNGMGCSCWSLAALLDVLPSENMLVKTTNGEYYCLAKDVMTKHYDNPVDACVAMVEELHELKIL